MDIRILGTESQGVRGLSCEVNLAHRRVVIDPGVALGFRRAGAPPHPVEVVVAENVKARLRTSLGGATDVVLSHFHGDHVPLVQHDAYQLSARQLCALLENVNLWTKTTENESRNTRRRAYDLASSLENPFMVADGKNYGWLAFSNAVPHGKQQGKTAHVVMTKVQEGEEIFVHASDTQLLDDDVVEQMLAFAPTILFVSGPPLYMNLEEEQGDVARKRALKLAEHVQTLILDHHVLRDHRGIDWLQEVNEIAGSGVMCAADYMNENRQFLEAQRRELYRRYPVPNTWHTGYARGKATTAGYRGLV